MAARRVVRPRGIERVQPGRTKDPETNRALGTLAAAVQKVQERRNRFSVEFNLVVGVNRITHSLGRPYQGYTITPTIITAAFNHAISVEVNPRKDREIWIEVIGADQPKAVIEIY